MTWLRRPDNSSEAPSFFLNSSDSLSTLPSNFSRNCLFLKPFTSAFPATGACSAIKFTTSERCFASSSIEFTILVTVLFIAVVASAAVSLVIRARSV